MTVRYPDGHVLLRKLDRDFPVITHGEGPYLFDESGKRYFDGAGGALVVSVGHGNQAVVSKIAEQLGRVGYVNGTQFTTEVTEKLANQLSEKAEALSSKPSKRR